MNVVEILKIENRPIITTGGSLKKFFLGHPVYIYIYIYQSVSLDMQMKKNPKKFLKGHREKRIYKKKCTKASLGGGEEFVIIHKVKTSIRKPEVFNF